MLMMPTLPLFSPQKRKKFDKESARETRASISAVTLCMNSTPSTLISQSASHFQPQVFACKQYKFRVHSSPHLKKKKKFAHTFYHIREGSDSKQFLLRTHKHNLFPASSVQPSIWHTSPDFKHISFFLLGLQFGRPVYQSVFHANFRISYFTDHKAVFFCKCFCCEATGISTKIIFYQMGS